MKENVKKYLSSICDLHWLWIQNWEFIELHACSISIYLFKSLNVCFLSISKVWLGCRNKTNYRNHPFYLVLYMNKKRVAQTIVWSWNRNDFRCIVYTFISNLLVQKMPHNDNGTTCQLTFDTNTWLYINSTKPWLINKWFTINTFKWFIFPP